MEKIAKKLSDSKGPVLKGTKADYVKFHDDKTTYTGVYAKGGPESFAKGGKVDDLSKLTNRKEADVRGINKDIKKSN